MKTDAKIILKKHHFIYDLPLEADPVFVALLAAPLPLLAAPPVLAAPLPVLAAADGLLLTTAAAAGLLLATAAAIGLAAPPPPPFASPNAAPIAAPAPPFLFLWVDVVVVASVALK